MNKNMNSVKLELPDGRLVTINGGNAADTARFITQHYLTPSMAAAEEALPAPAMTFEQRCRSAAPVAALTANYWDEPVPEALPTFERASAAAPAPAAPRI